VIRARLAFIAFMRILLSFLAGIVEVLRPLPALQCACACFLLFLIARGRE
jgi:hypothetical protein